MINKKKSTPLYYQLYELIYQKIKNEEYKEGDLIPSEKEMQKEYGISRITVRRTISDLEHDGLVKTYKGKGTVVLPLKKDRDLLTFQSFSEAVKVKGDRPSSVILKYEVLEAPSKVYQLLEINPGEPVIFLKRLRLINGRIIALNITYVRSDMGFTPKPGDFNEKTSLYNFLEDKGIELGSADEILEARNPTDKVSKALHMEEKQPIFYKERVTYSKGGEPIEYSEISYIADNYKYHIHIEKVGE